MTAYDELTALVSPVGAVEEAMLCWEAAGKNALGRRCGSRRRPRHIAYQLLTPPEIGEWLAERE